MVCNKVWREVTDGGFLGRRSENTKSAKNSAQQSHGKTIGSSAALNVVENKRSANKKRTHSKPKNGNDSSTTNLARAILNNLNIFSKTSCYVDVQMAVVYVVR